MAVSFKDLKAGVSYNVSYPAEPDIKLHNPHLCLHLSAISGNAIFVNSIGETKETNLENSHDMWFVYNKLTQ